MRNKYRFNYLGLSAIVWMLTLTSALAQTVRGRVTDGTTKSAIPGATIVVANTNTGSTADANGIIR